MWQMRRRLRSFAGGEGVCLSLVHWHPWGFKKFLIKQLFMWFSLSMLVLRSPPKSSIL